MAGAGDLTAADHTYLALSNLLHIIDNCDFGNRASQLVNDFLKTPIYFIAKRSFSTLAADVCGHILNYYDASV